MKEYPEGYYPNEGEPSVILNLPDDINLKAIGITLNDNYSEIEDD